MQISECKIGMLVQAIDCPTNTYTIEKIRKDEESIDIRVGDKKLNYLVWSHVPVSNLEPIDTTN